MRLAIRLNDWKLFQHGVWVTARIVVDTDVIEQTESWLEPSDFALASRAIWRDNFDFLGAIAQVLEGAHLKTFLLGYTTIKSLLVRKTVAFFSLRLEPSQTWLEWGCLLRTGLLLRVQLDFVQGAILPVFRGRLWVLHLKLRRGFQAKVLLLQFSIWGLAHERSFDFFGGTSAFN